ENNADDIQGTNNGTLQGGATFVPGKVGQAFSLDGSDDYVLVPDPPDNSLDFSGDVTVDAWINPSLIAGSQREIVSKRAVTSPDVNFNFFLQPDGRLAWAEWNGGSYTTYQTTPLILTGVYSHVAVAIQGSTITFYVNGVSAGSFAYTNMRVANDGDLTIGNAVVGGTPTAYFNGQIDEVDIFNRGRTASEIAAIADAGNAGKCHTSTIQFDSATYEVTEGKTNKTITVTRTGAHDTSASFHYASSAGSATNGSDYDDVSGDLTFDPGQTTKTFDVPIHEDNIFEGDETVNLTRSNVTGGATLGSPSSATLTIHDNDSQPTISINDVTINEGNSGTTDFDFTVSLSNPSYQTITVNAQTADNTATTADSDYTGVSSTLLTFSPGITTQHVHVLVNGDTKYELNETFFVNLSGETNATILDGQGLGTITNDDSPGAALVVNTTDDVNDGVCDGTHCSLREAINAANTSPSAVTINFSIPASDPRHFYYADDNSGSPGTPNGTVSLSNVTATTATDDTTIVGIDPDWAHSWWSIRPTIVLPNITQTVVLDGYTQCPNPTQCAQTNSASAGTNAILRIELDGSLAGPFSGLTVTGSSAIVRGLAINRYSVDGLNLSGSTKTITGNFIGTDVSGTLDLGNGNGITSSASNSTIGGA